MHHGVWELVFLMVILKVPIVYLCGVVYYAIKAKPVPGEGAGVTAELGPTTPGPEAGWSGQRPTRFRPRPHGGPTRTYPRVPRAAQARAEADRR
jgi:hypothetical protein